MAAAEPPDPIIEHRIKAAIELAGLTYETLANRIATPNYGAKTLQNIASPSFKSRVASDGDLLLIARACGVSDAFWTVDFRTLEDESLRAEVSDLRRELRKLATTVAQQSTELRALRGQGHRREPPGDDPR